MTYNDDRHRVDGARARAQIEEQRAEDPKRRRRAETAELVSAETAAKILGGSIGTVYGISRYLTRTSRSLHKKAGLQGVGALYVRAELEAIVGLAKAADIAIGTAARVVAALRKLKVPLSFE